MQIERLCRYFGTHDGVFHADEVTACALLLLFDCIDKDKIIRSRSMEVYGKAEYICDVGGIYLPEEKRFDHHQAAYQGDFSSAGMILHYLQEQKVIKPELHTLFYENLVRGIDLHDNGRSPTQFSGFCLFSHVVSNYNPINYNASSVERYQSFVKALEFVLDYLKRLLAHHDYLKSCKTIVDLAMKKDKDCLMFTESFPWLENFFELGGEEHSATFIIMPSGENQWKLRGIPPNFKERMKVRIPLPKHWAGLLEKDLQTVSGIKGGVFCHKERFTSVWKSREDALKALAYVLNNHNC